MSVKVITEYKLYCENEVGDFSDILVEGDDISLETSDGDTITGSIDYIYPDEILVATDDGCEFIKVIDIETIKRE